MVMKKVLFISLVLLAGCTGPTEEITTYVNSNNTVKLKIRHAHNGNSITVEINNAEEARQYKDRMQKIIRYLEDFEKELSIREKK
jgi:helix-turn-helix protein